MYYSQYGQDEYLLYLASKLCGTIRTVVDIGAHTPHALSNSRCFLEDGYKGLLVEASSNYSREWKKFLFENNLDARVVHERIKYSSNSIDSLLEKFLESNEIAILFLDIDGSEYFLLEGMKKFRPKFICVEYDNSYPLSIDYVPITCGNGRRHQASSLSMFKLMKSMNYLYLSSHFQDHIFIDKHLYEQVHPSSKDFPAGDFHFFACAPKSLFTYDGVLLNQFDGNGSAGVNFFASKVRNLVMNGQLLEAQQYFHHLELILSSYSQIIKSTRSPSYFSQYSQSVSEFCHKYHLLFSSPNMF